MRSLRVPIILLLPIFLEACALSGDLRQDLDDQPPAVEPTFGGVWPERSLLEDPVTGDQMKSVGHSDRGLASEEGMVSPTYSQSPNQAPMDRDAYRYEPRATKRDFVDNAPAEGSLWASDGQTNYFFTKNKVKALGDIVTLQIQDGLMSDLALEIKKTLSEDELRGELENEQKKINEKFMADGAKAKKPAPAAGAKKDGSEEEAKSDVPRAKISDIDLKDRLGVKSGDLIMAEVVERYPNGNYKIRGTKRVPFAGGMRLLTVIGIAKANDISDTDSVESGKLYEYRLKAYR